MFTPIRHGMPGLESTSGGDSNDEIVVLHREGQVVPVDHDGFTIGSSSQCDLVISDSAVSLLHAIIHGQSGAHWIEAAHDDALIQINQHSCRRMALRDGDQIQIGSVTLLVKLQSRAALIAKQERVTVDEDLSLLSAEELCDRIIAEQSMVTEYEEGRQAGWDALFKAIEAAREEILDDEKIDESLGKVEEKPQLDQLQIEELLKQIQELNQSITNRHQDLTEREREILESAKLLDQQMDIADRLEDVLDQLNNNDPPNGLRASA